MIRRQIFFLWLGAFFLVLSCLYPVQERYILVKGMRYNPDIERFEHLVPVAETLVAKTALRCFAIIVIFGVIIYTLRPKRKE